MRKKDSFKKFDKVEWEIVRADIAVLKDEQESSGDRKKWEESQKQFGDQMFKSNRELYDGNNQEQYANSAFGSDPRIKPKKRASKKTTK